MISGPRIIIIQFLKPGENTEREDPIWRNDLGKTVMMIFLKKEKVSVVTENNCRRAEPGQCYAMETKRVLRAAD